MINIESTFIFTWPYIYNKGRLDLPTQFASPPSAFSFILFFFPPCLSFLQLGLSKIFTYMSLESFPTKVFFFFFQRTWYHNLGLGITDLADKPEMSK